MKAKCIRKKPICLGILSAFILFMVCFAVFMNPNRVSAQEIVRVSLMDLDQSIDKEIESNSLLAYSSNPYDYIQDNQYYNHIIELGIEALPHLEKTLQASESNGLCEYIIAIATEELTQANLNVILDEEFGWENAKDFEKKWTEIKKNALQDVKEIILSTALSENEKLEKVTAYGVLAVPAIESAMRGRQAASTFEKELATIIDHFKLSQSEKAILDSYMN